MTRRLFGQILARIEGLGVAPHVIASRHGAISEIPAEKVRKIEHVAKVEPCLLAMNPTEGHNFAMHVGLPVGDAKRLKSNSIPAREDSP